MLHDFVCVDNDDTSAPFTSTGTVDRDLAYEAWLDDVARNNAAAEEAELELMAQQAEREAAAGFHDLTEAKREELMQFFPTGYSWMPVIGYNAGAAKPFTAELRRGTEHGPDIARVGEFTHAESAFRSAVWFANEMLLTHLEGSEAEKAAIRAKITYARPVAVPVAA